jgi:hypothetical protein
MKKNYWFYLVAAICAGLLFSCGKDDPDPDPVDTAKVVAWKDALGSYGAEGSLKLTINEAIPATDLKTLTLAAGTGEGAKITLTNIVPDQAALEIDNVTMVEDAENVYTFSAEANVGSTTIAVAGSLSGIAGEVKTLDLKVSRKINSPLTGAWKATLTRLENPYADDPNIVYLGNDTFVGGVHINIQTGDEATDEMLKQLPEMARMALAQKLAYVTAILGEDGRMDVSWTETGKSEASAISAQYFISDNVLYWAFDKPAVDLGAILSAPVQDRGGFILLPIGLKTDGWGDFTLFIGKDLAETLIPVLMPALAGKLPEGLPDFLVQSIQNLPDLAVSAETFEIGLSFMHL